MTLCDPWTLQSMEFSRPESWSGEPFPSPGDLPNLGIEPRSPELQADFLPAEPQGKPEELLKLVKLVAKTERLLKHLDQTDTEPGQSLGREAARAPQDLSHQESGPEDFQAPFNSATVQTSRVSHPWL